MGFYKRFNNLHVISKFKKGDYVYFYDREDTIKAEVMEVGKGRILIERSIDQGARRSWVSPGNCELQDWVR